MRWFRTRLSWLVAGWLAGQLTVFLAAPLAVSHTGVVLATCDCVGGTPGKFCPMHSPGHEGAPGDNDTMRSTCAPQDAALLSLGLGLGILPTPAFVPVEHQVRMMPVFSAASFDRSEFPNSPPPRA